MIDARLLIGTWKLTSYVVTASTGMRSAPFGQNPDGFLTYTADGRMHVIGASENRVALSGRDASESDRAALHDSLFAYAGRYSVEADDVVHHVDISWNETWTGTDQVRHVDIHGNRLILSTRIAEPGSESGTLYTLEWEKLTNATA